MLAYDDALLAPLQGQCRVDLADCTYPISMETQGGASIEPPKSGGGGVREKGSIDRHH